MRVRRSRGFTLIEVLVVVGIIALMVGIMMPSLKEVRRLSRRVVCQKCLDQIGIAMHNYLVDHQDTFPYAARLPSWEKLEAGKQTPPRKPLPSIPAVLRQEVKGVKEVFLCPADKNTMARAVSADVQADEVIPTERYFDNEGISYEWEKMLNGSKLDFKVARIYVTSDDRTRKYELAKLNKNNMWMMYDFEAFHGGPKIRGSQNILYTDLHVDSDKWREDKKVGVAMIPPVSY